MRCQLSVFLVFTGSALQAQSKADSALVARILAAEDRRDPSAAVYAEGLASADERIRDIARRARARVADPNFSARDSIAAPDRTPQYADPAWRLRYRALAQEPVDCRLLETALGDSAWPVRMRALDLAGPEC